MDKRKKSKVTEIVLLSIIGAVWLLGFILAILGVVAYNLPTHTTNNPLYSAQKALASFLGLGNIIDFRILGTIIFLIAMVLGVAVLFHYANKYDQIKAKKARREERRKNLLNEIVAEEKVAEEAVATDSKQE